MLLALGWPIEATVPGLYAIYKSLKCSSRHIFATDPAVPIQIMSHRLFAFAYPWLQRKAYFPHSFQLVFSDP